MIEIYHNYDNSNNNIEDLENVNERDSNEDYNIYNLNQYSGNESNNNESNKNEPYNDEPYDNESYNNEPYNNEPYDDESYNNEPYDDESYNNEPYNDEPNNNEPYNDESYDDEPNNNESYNDESYNDEGNNVDLPVNLNNNNFMNYQVSVIDISNLQNIREISRSATLEQIYNINNNRTNLNSNFLINLIENNLNNIIQNSIIERDDSPFIESFINSTFELDNKKKFKRVTDDDEVKKLKIQKFDNSNNYRNNECPITLTKFEENDEIIILPCKHVYSASSIKKWLNEESNCCPTCRFELKYKEIKCEENNNNINEENNQIEEINPIDNYSDDENDLILQQILINSYSSNNSR